MKKIISIFLVCIMIFSAVPISVLATEGVTYIEDVQGLMDIALNPRGDYALSASIELSGEWSPLCCYEPFSGTLDGRGYTISGLRVKGDSQYAGLFGVVSGKIKNLTVEGNVSISEALSSSGNVYAGLVAGMVTESGSFFRVSASGDVTAEAVCSSLVSTDVVKAFCGGLAGYYSGTEGIRECAYTGGKIFSCGEMTGFGTAYALAGGIAGKITSSAFAVYSLGEVVSDAYAVSSNGGRAYSYGGGIAGQSSSINQAYNIGDVTSESTDSAFSGAISGYINGIAENCYYLNGCASEPFGKADVSATATGLSASASKKKANYPGFDFNNIWDIPTIFSSKTPYFREKTAYLSGSISASGKTEFAQKLTANLSKLTPSAAWNTETPSITYQWYIGSVAYDEKTGEEYIRYSPIEGANKTTYTTVADDVCSYVKLVVYGTKTYGGYIESEGYYIQKKNSPTPEMPGVQELGDTFVILKEVENGVYGYSAYENGKWSELSFSRTNEITGLKPETSYMFYVKLGESSTHYESMLSEPLELTTLEKGYNPYEITGEVIVDGACRYGGIVNANTSGISAPRSDAPDLEYQWYRNGVAIEGATDKSYNLKKLDVGQKISVSVKGVEPYTGVIFSQEAVCGLFYPSAVNAENSANGIILSWDDVYGATEYVVYTCIDGELEEYDTVSGKSCVIGGLENGVLYEYTVAAVCGNYVGEANPDGAQIMFLSKPGFICVDEFVESQATVSWDEVTGAEGYNVYRNGTIIARRVQGLSYQDIAVVNEIPYEYQVEAVNGSWSSQKSEGASIVLKGEVLHIYGQWVIDREPSCTQKGLRHRKCDFCDAVQTVETPEKGHSYGEWVISSEASCGVAGVKFSECTVCGNLLKGSISAKEHFYGYWEILAEPTCKNNGMKARECSLCEDVQTEEIPKTEHIFGEWIVSVEPACNSQGMQLRFCESCGQYESEAIPTTEHSFSDWDILREPTCESTGYKERSCSECGLLEEAVIPRSEHTPGEWIVEKKATVNRPGEKALICKACSECIKTKTIPQLVCAEPVLKKVKATQTSVNFYWYEEVGADSYRVYRSTDGKKWSKLADTDKLYITDTTVKSGVTYYYTVKAKNEAGYSTCEKPGMDILFVKAPKVTRVANGSSYIKIEWGKISGADKYKLYRKTSASGTWKCIEETTKLEFKDKDIKAGNRYYYTVKACDGGKSSAYYDGSDIIRVEKPVLKSVTATSKGVKLTWSKQSKVDGYIVYRKEASGEWVRVAKLKSSGTVSYVDKSARKGVSFTYGIKAYKSTDKSAMSKEYTVKAK